MNDVFALPALQVVLQALAEVFPEPLQDEPLAELAKRCERLPAQLEYLQQHGMVTYRASGFTGNWSLRSAAITATGMDWLRPDGGLTEARNLLTVRIADETVRQLLTAHIKASSASTSAKRRLVAQIQALPAESLSTLAAKALEAGLARLPDGVHWLQTMLAGQ